MGLPFGSAGEPVRYFQSHCGHEVRTLSVEDEGDYTCSAQDTAADIVARIWPEWQPDLLLCWCPEVMPPPLQVEDCPLVTAAVVSDWTVYYPQLEHNVSRYDILITDRLGSQVLQFPHATPRYLGPIYSHRTGVHQNLGQERDIDIAFAGNLNHAAHVRRGRLLEKIAALSGRFRVVIASGLGATEYTQLLNRARIVFNHGLRREMNLRCFEAIACGALLFIEEDNLEISDYLRDRHEIVLYRPDNLTTLLEEYLSHPQEIATIAASAHARISALAGETRLDAMLNTLAQQTIGSRMFHTLSEPQKRLADVMQYASSPVAGQRVYAKSCLEQSSDLFPEDIPLRVSFGCMALEDVSRAAGEARRSLVQAALEAFRDAATACPQAAPLWLNLAFVSRFADAIHAEARFLEYALDAATADFGGLLMGERRDPYYARWREALAYHTSRVEHLWAAAAARLAEVRRTQGDLEAAEDLAQRSIGWLDDIAAPYQVLARCAVARGRLEEAAALLEKSLPLTALDSPHRMALIDVYQQLGRPEPARDLARESARIFSAWWGAESVSERFAEIAATPRCD